MAFGERLQEVRKRSGLTQEEFAEQLQVSRQSVSRWESGRGYPEMEKIIFICNRYGVTMDELSRRSPTPASRRSKPAAVRAHARQRVVKPVRESVDPTTKASGSCC